MGAGQEPRQDGYQGRQFGSHARHPHIHEDRQLQQQRHQIHSDQPQSDRKDAPLRRQEALANPGGSQLWRGHGDS